MPERDELSRRQRQVLELLAAGVPARGIAARLGIAEATARNHISALLHRLGCHSQLQAVAVGHRRHLLLDDPGVAEKYAHQPAESAERRKKTGP